MKRAILSSLQRDHALEGFIGEQPCFKSMVKKLEQIANKDISVLLLGETGTGKTRCAEFIHHYSDRSNSPFIVYNCGVCPESLFESQIFGHVKGAFTGAHQDRPGLVEEAHMGTLVLDEINSLNLNSQVKLNHFLETGYLRRVGENRLRHTNVRIIAASNVDLHKEVLEGHFREDLYYRLSEYEVYVPPLRSRKEDIKLLAKYFIKKYAYLSTFNDISITPKALEALTKYDWPGNIRELENFIKRCLIDATSPAIDSIYLPQSNKIPSLFENDSDLKSLPWKLAKKQIISSFEKNYLQTLLNKYHGTVTQCAHDAGIHPSDFWKLMRKYNMKAETFR